MGGATMQETIRAWLGGGRRTATAVLAAVPLVPLPMFAHAFRSPPPPFAARIATPATAGPEIVPPSPLDRRLDALVRYAEGFQGTPYAWGGGGPGGFDCSGFVRFVYERFGVAMDHSSYAQFGSFPRVTRGALRRGDLVFFYGAGHVGLYVGGGRFIHATHTGDYVRISGLDEGWYSSAYAGAVRPPLSVPPSMPSTMGSATRRPEDNLWANSSASSA